MSTSSDTTETEPADSTDAPPEKWPAQYVKDVEAAEAAAQRSVCDFPDQKTTPKALTDALKRRVEVNLAQADGVTVTRVGGADPKVRKLEGPYSKRKPAGSA